MLANFRVLNFLSFAELNTLSLVKGKTRQHPNHVYTTPALDLLKFSTIYGANGAGKSNIIKAIKFSKQCITENELNIVHKKSYCRTNIINKDLESSFEYEIIINKVIYSYGFSILLSKGELNKEWMYEIKGEEEFPLFTMEYETKKLEIDIDNLTNSARDRARLLTYVEDFKELKKHDESLFLHFLNDTKSDFSKDSKAFIFNKVFFWFERKLEVISPTQAADRSLTYLEESDESIENFLKDFGTGITGIHVEDIQLDEIYKVEDPKFIDFVKEDVDEKLQYLQDNIQKIEKIDKNIREFSAMMRTENNLYSIKVNIDGDINFRVIKFCHYMDGEYYTLGEESDGTVRLLELYDIIKNKNEKIFVVDELDRSLHPNLTFNFVKKYLSIENKSQLIVSTHEDRILDLNIMRRDEIWFVEKNDIGESKIYSLEEFKTRFDKDIMTAYLDGRYGSIPKFKFFNN